MSAPGQSILVVEDNQVNALILIMMLRKHGWEPLVARDGLEGVEMYRRHAPKLILMDLQMPRMDGFAAAARILPGDGGEGPVIVAVTANPGKDIKAACAAAGFAEVLDKPIEMTRLVETVRRYVGAS